MKIAFVFPRTKYPSGQPPLGILYLAAYLRRFLGDAVQITVIDSTFAKQPREFLAERLRSERFDLVGISVMTAMVEDARFASRVVKAHAPETMVLWGGPHATVLPEEALAEDAVDAIAIGEAEETLLELVQRELEPEGVAGIWYKRNGEVVRNAPRPYLEDLGQIPHPARDLVDMEAYVRAWYSLTAASPELRGTSVIGSRGCPYACTYCQPTLRMLFGKRVRRRPVDDVLAELEELVEAYRLEAFMFEDDTFIADYRWAEEFAEGLIRSGMGLVWGCNVRADLVVRRPELLGLMREAGLVQMNMGIESGTQRILDDWYDKRITVEQVREAAALAKRYGIRVGGYFMLGAPTETRREVWQTIEFAARLPIDEAAFNITTPLPGTFLWERTQALVQEPLTHFDYYRRPVYRSDAVLPGWQLDLLKKWAYLRFYALTPRRALRILRDDVFSIDGLRKLWLRMKRF